MMKHNHHHHHRHQHARPYITLSQGSSFIPAISIAPLQVLYTTQRRSRLQHGYCIGVSRRSAQATVGKGLAQGPYVAARAEVEPTTLRLKVIVSTKAPPQPTVAPSVFLKHFFTHNVIYTFSFRRQEGPAASPALKNVTGYRAISE